MKKQTRERRDREKYLTTDFGDYFANAKPLRLDLEFPSPTQAISIRLPRDVLNQIKIMADDQDIPYQSLIKIWLVERLKQAA